MRSSIVVASLFAALAVASPVHQAHQDLHKKAIVYDVVTDIVYVTVTAGQEPDTVVKVQKTVYVNPVPAATTTTTKKKTRRPRPTTTSNPPPPPPPAPTTVATTTTPPPPPPPPSTEPSTEAPAPTSPAAPVVEAAKSTAAAPAPSADPAPSSSTSASGDAVKDAALNYHNEKRALHHVGSVSWDDSLAADAAKLAQSCTNEHAIYGSYGQNIAASADSTEGSQGADLGSVMTKAAEGWYNEVTDFANAGLFGQANVQEGSTQVLHFTQLVWKATTKIGCAVNYCGTNGNIFPSSGGFTFYAYTVVCNYQAAGNFGGQYANNVFAA